MRNLLLGLVLLVAAAGCSGTPATSVDPSTTGHTATVAAQEWMANLCTTAGELRDGLWTSATGDGPLRQRLRGQLDTAAGVIDTALDTLAATPAAPIEGADAAIGQLNDELTELRDSLVRGLNAMDALPEDADDEQVGQVLATVWPSAAARAADPFSGVSVSEAMRNAATAPGCAPFSFG